MRLLARAAVVARSWFRPAQVDREFSEELTFHVEREAQAYRESGMSHRDALRTARIAIGGLTAIEEQSRASRPGEGPRRLLRDLRFASRQLRRDRWYAVGAVLTLGLSVGATTAMYSALHAVLLNPLPVRDTDRLVIGWETFHERNLPLVELSYRYIEELTAGSNSFVSTAGVSASSWPTILEVDGEPMRVAAAGVTASFFDTLGVAPLYGRLFRQEDDLPNAPPVAILSHALWANRFGGAAVIGRTLPIGDGPAARVIGVMPQGFDYPPGTDIWIPVVPVLAGSGDDRELALGTVGVLFLVGRLRDGVTPQLARGELDRIGSALGPSGHRFGSSFRLTPIVEHLLGPVRPALLALFCAVLILLAIGCANVSALMLTRIARKRHEHAIRLALGSSKAAVGQLWMAQSLLLSLAGGALALLMARWMVAAISASAPAGIPGIGTIAINRPVAAFTFVVVMLTTLLCAVAPVREAALPHLAAALGSGGRTTFDRRSHRVRALLLGGQAALTVVLLVGAALVIRSFMNLRSVDLGFNPTDVLTLHVEPRSTPATNRWFDDLIGRLSQRADVEAAGATSLRPLALGSIGEEAVVILDGQSNTAEDARKNPVLNLQAATPGYFTAMGIPLKEGRLFNVDDTARSARVAMVSESTARKLWPHGSAIGQRFLLPNYSPNPLRSWRTVVGVVADVRYRGIDDVRLDVYDLAIQSETVTDDVMIRSKQDVGALAADVLAEARRLDPRVVVDGVLPMEMVVARATAPWRFSVWIFVLFSLLAVLLTGVGLFSTVSLDGASRRREFAIRLALGAKPAMLVFGMLWRSIAQLVPGIAIGFLVSLLAMRVLKGLLFNVTAIGTATFVGVGAFVVLATLVSSLLPALAAVRAQPSTTLSGE